MHACGRLLGIHPMSETSQTARSRSTMAGPVQSRCRRRFGRRATPCATPMSSTCPPRCRPANIASWPGSTPKLVAFRSPQAATRPSWGAFRSNDPSGLMWMLQSSGGGSAALRTAEHPDSEAKPTHLKLRRSSRGGSPPAPPSKRAGRALLFVQRAGGAALRTVRDATLSRLRYRRPLGGLPLRAM